MESLDITSTSLLHFQKHIKDLFSYTIKTPLVTPSSYIDKKETTKETRFSKLRVLKVWPHVESVIMYDLNY